MCVTFLTASRDFGENKRSIILIMIICEILVFIIIFFILCGGELFKIHHGFNESFNAIILLLCIFEKKTPQGSLLANNRNSLRLRVYISRKKT